MNNIYNDAEPIPSEPESVFSESEDEDDQILLDQTTPALNFTDSDTDPEDNVPLSILATNLLPVPPVNSNDWSKLVEPVPPSNFTSESGIKPVVREMVDPTPYKLFKLFFNDGLLDHIVFQTNLYAQQSFSKQKLTEISEIKTFLGINLLMGIKRLPSYRDYWSTSPDINDAYISGLMPVKRFSWLLSNFHLNNNVLMPKKGEAHYDKLYKVRPLLIALAENFERCMAPSRELVIDESMIKFKGRSSLKQYMPKKPIKRGYKVWILANKNGYCQKFDIYTGKAEDAEKQLGARVIKQMLNGLENKEHIVYFDNFFNSTELLEDLKKKLIHACGTVNPSRKTLPVFKPDRKLKRGEFEVFSNPSRIVAFKWRDKRSVYLLSNFHSPFGTTEVNRKEKNGTTTKVRCPQALSDYNANMNFVDKFDQNLNLYKINRKSKKWWHRIFFYFLDAAVVNAFVLYKELNSPKISMKEFRRSVSQGLVADLVIKNKRKAYSCGETVAKKQFKPFIPLEIRHNQSSHQPERDSRRRCAKCSTSKQQVRTNWICSVCRVPLCLGANKTCFQDFHTFE